MGTAKVKLFQINDTALASHFFLFYSLLIPCLFLDSENASTLVSDNRGGLFEVISSKELRKRQVHYVNLVSVLFLILCW